MECPAYWRLRSAMALAAWRHSLDSFNYRDDDLVQDYWSNDASLTLHSATADAGNRRKYLVFLVPRPDFVTSLLHIKPEDRNFDLAVRFYAPPGNPF